MANEYCKLRLINSTGMEMVLKDQHLEYGKFESPGKPPVAKIENGEDVFAFCAYGRESSPSGTEGWVSYKIGDEGEFKIYWDCSWSLFHDPDGKYKLSISPEGSYVVGIVCGGPGSGHVDVCLMVGMKK